MRSNSISRTRRAGWRFFLGLSVVGLLIVASASHASSRTGTVGGSGTTLVR
jgi:hypothetical protein